MQIEREIKHDIVEYLSDVDVKRFPFWVGRWSHALLTTYKKASDTILFADYGEVLGPLVFWLTPQERQGVAKIIWQRKQEWDQAQTSGEGQLFHYIDLALYLDPFVGTE